MVSNFIFENSSSFVLFPGSKWLFNVEVRGFGPLWGRSQESPLSPFGKCQGPEEQSIEFSCG